MQLDKSHINDFENITPPMLDAITLPIIGVEGVAIYVCRTPFNLTATRADVVRVAQALRLTK